MSLTQVLRAVALAAVLVFAGSPSTEVIAQQGTPAQEGFVPVDQLGDPKEELPATPLVAAAYGIAWAAVLVYVWSVWRRLNKVDRELAEVARRIEPGARR